MGYKRYKKLLEETKNGIEAKEEDLTKNGMADQLFEVKNAISNMMKQQGVKLTPSTKQQIQDKLTFVQFNINKTNPGNKLRYENEQKVENDKKIKDAELDRSVLSILAFVGKPEDYHKNVKAYVDVTFKQDKQRMFQKAFDNCVEFKKKVDDAKNIDDLINLYNENPFGFNALSEMSKSIDVLKTAFSLDKSMIDQLEKQGVELSDGALKEQLIEQATDPVSAYLSVDDCEKIGLGSGEEDVSEFITEDHPEIKEFMTLAAGVKTMQVKDDIQMQANGVLGKRDAKGRFQGLFNEVNNIDKGFSQKDTDNLDIATMKGSLNTMYQNLENNNTFFMRWRSKSNYPEIMKEVDIARRMNNKEDMLKQMGKINQMCEQYLDYKAGDKKSKNSVLRENAIFQLNEYCKSAVEKNPITTNKNKNKTVDKNGITTEKIEIPTSAFEATTEHGVSMKDIQNQRAKLKHVEKTSTEKQSEDEKVI